ncbi:bifunctional diguanylate cyclase/phosphodiesterase [Thiomicrorhabdus sediminis]|uniref:Bifunctional diguanylate cyclase/phosphodiesterase n=1 Tax=Thiomicrorhabdus sediminis TaxID=2580412 RepID=A0A4P9K6E6_9GAMM|nr:bifunctional diguanylate cyclase/phosphodiesterase [Thiomicrorhabdus sediminis]QCU90615.1 bifunctional diguanylate cyclase/phosphodiesterase [Thiomicrorhabdus sediminis]
MQTPKFLIRSIRFYYLAFSLIGLFILLFVDYTLYSRGQDIQKTVAEQTQLEAQKELAFALDKAIRLLQIEAQNFALWDEVHQQFSDPTYYFFWRDERLKETDYYQSHYDGVELYGADKKLLQNAYVNQPNHFYLPEQIDKTEAQVIFTKNTETHLNYFYPVQKRNSKEIVGYIGITIDFLPYLLKTVNFYTINPTSLRLDNTNNLSIPYTKLSEHIQYQIARNPVNDYLWQLIQEFIIELIILMLAVGLLVFLIFNWTIYRPLNVISQFLETLQASPNKVQPLPNEKFFLQEFEQLKHSIHDYHSNLQQAQNELDLQNQTVWEQARRDVLTNIYNRRAFDEAWTETVKSFQQNPHTVCFMLIDCDFFKALNDTYGHESGDEVIKLTASGLQKHLPIDCPPYRIGGDEFAVILQNRSLQQAKEIAQKCLHELLNLEFSELGIREKMAFSVGMSHTDDGLEIDIQHLPKQADIAMYKAKQSLKDKIQVYHQTMEKESRSLVSSNIANTIVNAIDSGDNMELHFQPIVSLKNDSVYYESLVRIQGEDGLIYPNDIFHVVERRRLEMELDYQIVQQVRKKLADKTIPRGSGVSINISAKTLLDSGFTELFKDIKPFLTDYKIVIEITETSLIDHIYYANKVLNIMRNDGFLIALDDFGSGYSSIRYLAHMPVDIIKFDMTMTQALLSKDSKTQQIIRTTAEMVLHTGYDLVFEGIEDAHMLDVVKQLGATHVQGYLLGRPAAIPPQISFDKALSSERAVING